VTGLPTGDRSPVNWSPVKGEPMESAFRQLPSVARKLGVTVDQCRYWLSLLGITISHQGRVRIIHEDVVELLGKVAELVKTGTAPRNACMAVKREIGDADILPKDLSVTSAETLDINKQLEGIKKALLLIVEQNKKTQDEVGSLRQENQLLRLQLSPPMEPERKIIPWQPAAPGIDPLAGRSWLKRFWVELTKPERMRRN